MSVPPTCPRCAGPVRPPNLMTSDWRCERDGVVHPYHVLPGVHAEAVEHVRRRARVPLWAPWPLPIGWTVTGVGYAGDDRTGARATALACTGPAPLGGLADLVLVAEEPGVGLGARYAALSGSDPGGEFATVPHAKVTVGGHPTPLWSVPVEESRCAYVGEAAGCWLWAVLWPSDAGYIFAEHVDVHDLRVDPVPMLVFGAPSPYLGAQPRA